VYFARQGTLGKSGSCYYCVTDPVPLCPNCKGRYPNKRMRKKPQYLCTKCRHLFDTPVYNTVKDIVAMYLNDPDAIERTDICFTSKDEYRHQQSLSKIKYWYLRNKAKDKYANNIGMEAFLNYLEDNIKYLSFENTMTCCKRCASSYDLHNMELCPVCKTNYKSIQYPTCIPCLPEDKRKAALEKIEFAKDMYEMHKSLGID